MRGRGWLVVLVALAMAGQAMTRGYAETGPRRATVSFDLYRDYLIVARGSVGPLKGLNFLLDTGASPAVVDPRVAAKLHLTESPASIAVVGGRVQAGMATLPSLEFGPVRRDQLPVLVEDLSFLQKALPVRIDAIIGLDVLGQSSFVIDYPSREIRFGPLPVLPVSVPLQVKDGLAIVDVGINNVPEHLLLDTGASSLTFFETRTQGMASVVNVSAVPPSSRGIGEFEQKQVRLHSLRLGGAEFGQEPAVVVQHRREPGQNFDGLMSPAALGITKVAVDLERGVLAFSR